MEDIEAMGQGGEGGKGKNEKFNKKSLIIQTRRHVCLLRNWFGSSPTIRLKTWTGIEVIGEL